MRTLLFGTRLSGLLLAGALAAQVPPGQYIVSVNVANVGEMYIVDPATRKATPLTIGTTLATDVPNCVHMIGPTIGYVGTLGSATVTADVYRILVAGSNVTATRLNTTATVGQNLAQIDRIGGDLYFTTQEQVTTSSLDGMLFSMPGGGGPVSMLVDFKTVTGWTPGTDLANALATDGVGKVWVCAWTVGKVFEYDITTKATKLLLTLPVSRYSSSTGFYPVHARFANKRLYVLGLYGDVVEVDVAAATVVNHWYEASATGTGYSNSKNSMCFNDNGDFAIGTRDGALDLVVPTGQGQVARRDVEGLGSSATATSNSVTGIWFTDPAAGSYVAYGAGCPGTGGFTPTSVGRGSAAQGNSAFGFGLDTTKMGINVAALLIGANQLAIDLTAAGMPGCFLRSDILVLVPTTTSGGAFDGMGSATLPVPLPNLSLAFTTQWIVFDASVNARGLVLSDGRLFKM